jgi:diguanylate cyclase (GGDEF)-like protein
LASKVITEKKTVFYNHFNINMVKRTNAVLVGEDKDESVVRSLIIVPLKLGKTIKGIMSTQSYSADAYSQEDKETLELLASHAVIALENSTLFSEVQELAITDSLTKVNNRRRFFDLAEQEFERSRRYNRPLSLIMLDIDHFKRVNDTYGHAAGDTVLERLAQLCQKSLREVDVFARYGGEEFVILLPETTSIEAQLTAERIRQLVARTPIEITGDSLTITISFGIVELDKDCKNVEELLDRSDQAMYASKRNGRNRVSIWGPSTPKLLNSN